MRSVRFRSGLIATLALGLGAFAATAVAGGGTPAPARIVSLNLCTDQLLVDLVPRERIAALSWLADDPSLSAVAGAPVAGLDLIRGTAEEVLSRDPDLVLAVEYASPATVALLRRLGRRVVVVPLAQDFDAIRAVVRTVAEAVGAPERGEELIAAFDAKLRSASKADTAARPTAVAYQVNSLASGPGTLVDAVIEAAGLRNLARDMRLGPAGRLPLESLVAAPPDLVVFAHAPGEFRTVLADNLRHPALAAVLARRPSHALPMPLWLCGTPRIADAVAALARARDAVVNGRPR